MLNSKSPGSPASTALAAARRLAGLPLVLLALILAGCGVSPTCSDVEQPYQGARAVPALKVPAGMDAPGRSGNMNVPAAATPAPTAAAAGSPGPEGKCLDEAPSYFGTAISPLSLPEEVVAVWAEAWSERQIDRMMATYSPRFEAPDGTASAAWLEQRREQVATGPVPRAGIQGLKVTQPAPDRRLATFAQRFDNNSIRRELTLVREDGFWRIVAERVVDLQ